MNIIEAIKSGKQFKRPHHKSWALISQHDLVFGGGILKEDLLADDWEIESTSVTITREQFDKAWHNAFTSNEPYGSLSRDELAKELGL